MNKKMTKYYIGLIVVALLTIGLLIFTISLGSSNKKDAKTEQKANEIANKLNSYISNKREIPDSLSSLDIKDIPDTIKYTKNQDSTYKFCVTYKSDASYGSSGPDITSLVFGSTIRNAQKSAYDNETYTDKYQPSTLYLYSFHKKGENCQTVKPYISSSYYDSSSYSSSYSSTSSSSSQSTSATSIKARDKERQIAINAIQAKLETYYAENAKYPSLLNLNSATWLAANLKGLDKETLKDPSGYYGYLYSTPYKNYYSYNAKSKTGGYCDNVNTDCMSYTLTATLEAGGTYVKKSLN